VFSAFLAFAASEGDGLGLQALASEPPESGPPMWLNLTVILIVLVVLVLAWLGWTAQSAPLASRGHLENLFYKVNFATESASGGAPTHTAVGYLRALDHLRASLLTSVPLQQGTRVSLPIVTKHKNAEVVGTIHGTVISCRRLKQSKSAYMTRLRVPDDELWLVDELTETIAGGATLVPS